MLRNFSITDWTNIFIHKNNEKNLENNIIGHKNKQDVYLIENMECLNPYGTI